MEIIEQQLQVCASSGGKFSSRELFSSSRRKATQPLGSVPILALIPVHCTGLYDYDLTPAELYGNHSLPWDVSSSDLWLHDLYNKLSKLEYLELLKELDKVMSLFLFYIIRGFGTF